MSGMSKRRKTSGMASKKATPKKSRGAPPPDEMKELPRRLRSVYEARKKKTGLRQETLAEASGVSQAVISDWMSEPLTEGMTVAALARLAKYLNVSMDYLVMGVGDEAPKLRRSQLPLPSLPRRLDESEIPPMFPSAAAAPPESKPGRNKER